MTAAQPPWVDDDLDADAPWTRRPPGSPPVQPPPGPPRRGLVVGLAVLVAVVAAVVVWALVLRGGGSEAGDAGTADPAGDAAEPLDPDDGVAEALPETDSDPDVGPALDPVDAELEALRASDRYVAFAEHERAREYEWPPGIVGAWEGFRRARYTNEEQLWGEVVGPIRDEALLAGEPFSDPVWEEIGLPAISPLAWSDRQTGRGDLFMYQFVFADPVSGEPVVRVHAVLIRKDEGHGAVVARMPPFEIRRDDVPGFTEASELSRERVWVWVQQQPPTSEVHG